MMRKMDRINTQGFAMDYMYLWKGQQRAEEIIRLDEKHGVLLLELCPIVWLKASMPLCSHSVWSRPAASVFSFRTKSNSIKPTAMRSH